MHDQADELRELVRRAALEHSWASEAVPRRIVVSGGKGGVGTTTVAVNLAVALASLGQRTVLVDANLNRGGVSRLCNLKEQETIAAVLAGRRTVHEVLQRGPFGLHVLPGVGSFDPPPECTPAAQDRLLHQLSGLGQHADVMIFDVGSGLTHIVQRFWSAADLVLLVATPEPDVIMDAYAAVKVLPPGDTTVRIRTLINQVEGLETGEKIHQRLAEVSFRFLGRTLKAAGEIPLDPAVRAASHAGQPLLAQHAASPAARQISHLAEQLLAALERQEERPGLKAA
ncbi:MAG TPA: P-loop NTPase [Pirellulales bacterium]|jgi:flagellar biosynthesis protein FlhG|nr:P-loop NTPase [Pirellulales bacterium]